MGGAETSLVELLRSVRDGEPAWQLSLVLGEDGPLAALAEKLNVEVIAAPFPRALARLGDTGNGPLATLGTLLKAAWGTFRYSRRLGGILRSLEPSIVHTNGFKMHVLGAWACPPGTRLVWHIHDYVSTRPLMSRLLGWFGRRCDAAIVNSKSVAADVRKLLPRIRVTPIYNAIDLQRFSADGTKLDLDALAGLSPAVPGTVRVGLVSTFARWKGHKTFLEALGSLPSESPVRGYVIGGPIYQTAGSQWSMLELEQEAQRLGLQGRLGFTGFVDAAPAMRSLDIIVHASTQPEPFGMVIIEGMACGKAVIACQAGGASELFVDGDNALGHSPGNAAMLARQIMRLAGDPALRLRLGQAGRLTAERLYHRKRLATELLALYRSIAGDPAGAELEAAIEA